MSIPLIIILVFTTAEANINCAGSSCSYCLSGYLYNSTSCLSLCPTGYPASSTTCISINNPNLFSLNFFQSTSFASSTIGSFSTPYSISFDDQSRLSPIPTKSQGFYFASTSQLAASQSWVLGPDYSLRIAFLAVADGTIFQINDGITFVVWLLKLDHLLWQ